MRSARFSILLVAATLVAPPLGLAQAPPRPGEDPLAKALFPPEFVLQHAQDIGLQAAQRSAIVAVVKEIQGDMIDLQLQMAERSQELFKLVGVPRVDEAATLAQVDRVVALERDMKRKQMQLLIRIKNALTPEQQERLAGFRGGREGDR